MMSSTGRNVLLVLQYFFLLAVNADLRITGVPCGTKVCAESEYCSPFDKLCQPCSNICQQSHHNFDEKRCITDCQNYLHDIRYSRNSNQNQSVNNDLRDEVRNLHYMVTVSLTLTCLLLVIILLAIVYVVKTFKWKKKHHDTLSWIRNKFKLKEKTKPDHSTTVAVTTTSGKPDLRLDMPTVGLQTPSVNGNTPSTATTTLSRRPTEDNTLDYAYDNPVMVSTPSPNAKPHESSL